MDDISASLLLSDSGSTIFTHTVRAGKRTYFFDVKDTRKKDRYITITESRKKVREDNSTYFEKHKIFVFKEDFDKFSNGLQAVIDFIRSSQDEELTCEEVCESARVDNS